MKIGNAAWRLIGGSLSRNAEEILTPEHFKGISINEWLVGKEGGGCGIYGKVNEMHKSRIFDPPPPYLPSSLLIFPFSLSLGNF